VLRKKEKRVLKERKKGQHTLSTLGTFSCGWADLDYPFLQESAPNFITRLESEMERKRLA